MKLKQKSKYLELNKIHHGDCLKLMNKIKDKSVDMILCDLPYNMVKCKWDILIPFNELWSLYERIIKDRGAIVLTSSQPFTAQLIMSNLKLFKYELIWVKNVNSNFANSKRQPLKHHESILIFYKKLPTYNPQNLIKLKKPKVCRNSKNRTRINHIEGAKNKTYLQTHTNYPKSILEFDVERGLHATQKPVSLFEYLIRTYTKRNQIILDNCAGSATTAIAAINSNRNYILIEKEKEFVTLGRKRIKQHIKNKSNKFE